MENALSALRHVFAPSSHFKRDMRLHGSRDAIPEGFTRKGPAPENAILHFRDGWSGMESRVFKLGSWMSALCAAQPTTLQGGSALTWTAVRSSSS